MLDLIIIRTRYLEENVVDGNITESDVTTELVENLDLHEAIDLCRREGVRFDATGTDWAALPDGSFVRDYGTGEREEVTIHPQGSWWPHEFAAFVAGVDGEHSPSLSFGYLALPADPIDQI